MIDQALLIRIKDIEIRAKKILQGIQAGNKRSQQKGYGIDFDQIRDYQFGDDVRFIDWKSSARTNKILVKQFFQENTRTVLLAVDSSASMQYSSTDTLKYHCAIQAAVVMGLIAQNSQDSVGLIIFSDEVELYVPPKKGAVHLQDIINKLINFKALGKQTKLDNLTQFMRTIKRQNIMLCLFSDFIDESYEKLINGISKKTDLLVVRCLDPLELSLPSVGILQFVDIESPLRYDVHLRNAFSLCGRIKQQSNFFLKYNIDACDIFTDKPFFDQLIQFLLRNTKK